MEVVGQQVEGSILRFAPDVTLMHVTASADVIAKRMRENPHSNSHFKEEDIQHALDWFAEASERCLFSHKITLDTSSSSVEETMAEFEVKIEPHLSEVDRSRILVHNNWG